MRRYQDVYPSGPLVESKAVARASAADLLTCEYFEAEPASMPTERFAQHHILINLHPKPLRVENWRDGEHRDFTFNQNEIVVTPAGVESGWRWHERSQCIVITCEPVKLERFAGSELGLTLTEAQLRDEPQFVDADLAEAARGLVSAIRTGGAASAVLYESLARVFLVKLIQKYGLEREDEYAFTRSFTARHYKAVLDLVRERFSERITLDDMAAIAGLSPYHFARLFRTTIGEPPYQFVRRYRVEQAERLLAEPAMSMVEIALACGFSDQAHLSRTFKAITGRTPSQFRETLKQDRTND
ncbi:MAG: AraC family transcriptional regulator [Pseudomonadota bacterium]